jgi:hypothetical protein
MVLANSDRVSRAPPYSGYHYQLIYITCTGLSPSAIKLSSLFHFCDHQISWSYNPKIAETTLVWATSRSLATTREITFVFFSCAYLDVSVQHVRLSFEMTSLQLAGLPHSDICDFNGYLHLIATFRSLSRPSSPLRA